MWCVSSLTLPYLRSHILIVPDVAIFMMSLHMSLQIFHSTSGRLGPDGLYRVRFAVYAIWIVLPLFMAGLAFINKSGAYLSQGAFCTLPIRPFWYRLALSWVPRYLVWIYITITAIRIYMRVGSGFTVFARKVDSSSNNGPSLSSTRDHVRRTLTPTGRRPKTAEVGGYHGPLSTQNSALSTPDVEIELGKASPTSDKTYSDTLQPNSAAGESDFDASRIKDSNVINGTTDCEANGAPLIQISSATEATHKTRRKAIQRQTRLLFIYPCVYMILMVIPFVQHCMNYSDYYAQHPIFALSLLNPCCLSIMGFADCLVFGWRETPWRNIPGADGTFLGSLRFWELLRSSSSAAPATAASREFRRALIQLHQQSAATGGSERQPSHVGSLPTFTLDPGLPVPETQDPGTTQKMLETMKLKRPSPRRVFSGSSDRAALAAERAAERLALERAAAAAAQLSPGFPPKASPSHLSPQTATRRDWFDRRGSLWEDAGGDDTGSEGGTPGSTPRIGGRRKFSLAGGKLRVPPIRTGHREHEKTRRDFGAM